MIYELIEAEPEPIVYEMIDDDADKLGPVQIQTPIQSDRAKACHIYDWLLTWNLRAANTFSSFDNVNVGHA